jgi:plastocyanin
MAGGDVTWTNADGYDHTVKAGDGSFDSREIKPGKTYTMTFATAGTHTYYGNIHNSMTGSVVVT